jgi:hypothetical protein
MGESQHSPLAASAVNSQEITLYDLERFCCLSNIRIGPFTSSEGNNENQQNGKKHEQKAKRKKMELKSG